MEPVRIIEVTGSRQAAEFIDFPYRLYRGYPHWVPPLRIAEKELLDRHKHPFYRHATMAQFLALRGKRTVGRIAAILDPRYSEFHQEQSGFFGFFEAEDDQETASALLAAARDWLSERGAAVLRGPVNPSTNYACGVLVDPFDSPPSIMMTYNPPYYDRLITGAGWQGVKNLYAYDLPVARARRDRVQHMTERAKASGLAIRTLRLKEFDAEVERVWQIYNSAWEKNWGFVPMTREEFIVHGKEMKQILVPDLALFAEVEGQPAGFALAVPDINQALAHVRDGRLLPFGLPKLLWYQRKIDAIRVIILGVKPAFRQTAAAAGLYAALIEACERLGYRGAECSWVLDDNVLMRRAIEALGGSISKTYRIYGLTIPR